METPIRFEDELISHIKEKQELSSLNDEFVRSVLRKKLASYRTLDDDKYASFKQFKRSAFCKQLLSDVRKYLRDVYGVFLQKPLSSFTPLVDSLNSVEDDPIDRLLQSHQSTRERVPYYDEIYSFVWDICKKCGVSTDSFSVLDLACGWNPFALKYFPVIPKKYFASDISSDDMHLIGRFFANVGVNGETESFDMLSPEFTVWLEDLPFVDVCFLFKALDSLEYASRNSSKRLLQKLSSKCRFVVVSFSRVSIGGRQEIDAKRRLWFESWCEKNGWVFEVSSVPNELFYVCFPPQEQ